MHLVIVGAGPVGNSLVSLATDAGHDVIIVEPNAERAETCADRHDVRVLNMDVADDSVAEQADLEHAQAIIATTTDDSTNLMAMFLAQEHKVEVLTSTVNHNGHRPMFERLGVHVLADPEFLVAQHLLDITLLPHAADVTTLQDREQVIEVTLTTNSKLNGRTLGDIHRQKILPKGLFIVSIERGDDDPFFPGEDTELAAGDHVIVFSRRRIRRDTLTVFCGDPATQ